MKDALDDNAMEQAILATNPPAPRLTPVQINELHSKVKYVLVQPKHTTTTFVHAYLPGQGGREFFLTTGMSACVSPENFNAQIGSDIAHGKAMSQARDRLWELEGYHLFKQLDALQEGGVA